MKEEAFVSIQHIDGKRFGEMILQGAANLGKNVQLVDSLNVFPVPDGDTGTNMNLSITSGAKEVRNNPNIKVGAVGKSFAKGLLMGARGNSGVILSQLFRGFSKSIEGKDVITTVDFAEALEAGVTTAYQAVMKPVEGTILTVAKDAAKKAIVIAKKEKEFIPFMELMIEEAHASLDRTPDLLPVLKEVGVVDSGGKGLVIVYEGFLAELKGEKISDVAVQPSIESMVKKEHHINAQSHLKTEDIEFGYCTEFMVQLEDKKLAENPFSVQEFREVLNEMGDSLLVVADEDVVKVHVHTEYPGTAMNYAQKFGSLINMKIENMREQHSNLLFEEEQTASVAPAPQKPKEKQEYGIVTVAMGSGIKELFESIGATKVIEGGQTMNPSTEDIVKAIEEANAEKIIILPNNSNIVMAAKQAASVVDQDVVVVESKTVPQGMAAILAFNPNADLVKNEQTMRQALSTVKTGQITYAVRDTQIDGVEITKDDYMGIADGKIVTTDKERTDAVKKLLENMMTEEDEILTIIQGEDVSDQEVNDIVQFAEETFEDVEVEVHQGHQPIYAYIFSVE